MIYGIEGRKGLDQFVDYLIEEKKSTSRCYSNIETVGCTLYEAITTIDFEELEKESQDSKGLEINIFNFTKDEHRRKLSPGRVNTYSSSLGRIQKLSKINFYFIAEHLDLLDKRLRRSMDYRYTVLFNSEKLYYRLESLEELIPESVIEEGDIDFGSINV